VKGYTNYGPAVPHLIRLRNTYVAGDIDGDGRSEIISYCPANNSINVLAYFEYGDASSRWASVPGAQMVNAYSRFQDIPPVFGIANGWTRSGTKRLGRRQNG